MVTKEEIIDKIQKIDDASILEDLMELIDLELGLAGDVIKLNPQQKAAIDQGLKDIEEGRLLSNEEANRMVDEWMRKR